MTSNIESARRALVDALREAAELEHAVCCMYLFAAFSLKRNVSEGVSLQQLRCIQDWCGDLLLIARQEMEHLGLVGNLLAAIGEPPHFARPNFPLKKHSYGDLGALTLDRFSMQTVERLLGFEQPEDVRLRRVLLRALDREDLDFDAKLRTVVEKICVDAHWDYGEAWVRGEDSRPVCVFLCHLGRYGRPEIKQRFCEKARSLVGSPHGGAEPELRQRLLEPPEEALWRLPPPQCIELRDDCELFDIKTSFPLIADGAVVAVLVFYHRVYQAASDDGIIEVVHRALNAFDEDQHTTVGAALLKGTPRSNLEKASELTVPSDLGFSTVGGFYRKIRRMLQELAKEDQHASSALFTGRDDGQFKQKDLGLQTPGWFNINFITVENLATALQVLDQIITQGEGTTSTREDSHYGRLRRIHHCLKDEPAFQPARNVVPNPSVAADARPGTTRLSHKFTRELAVFANNAYENTLLILTEYQAQVHDVQTPLTSYMARMFMAAMSALIRPLGEMLTQLPASGGSERAGPCFELRHCVDRRLGLASIVERWREMAEQGRKLASDGEAPARLKSVVRNLSRLARNLEGAVRTASDIS
jgi:Ferritin-like